MPTFNLQPVGLGHFDSLGPNHHAFSIRSRLSASELWSELHSEQPLSWCTGLRAVEWTSPVPRHVGATRQVRLANGVRLDERYFLWREGPDECVNAFFVESAGVPLFRRFGERYRVTTAADGGSRFTWEFYIEPRVPAVLAPLARRLIARDIDNIRRDAQTHFGSVHGAD